MSLSWFSSGSSILVELEFEVLGFCFCGRRKTGEPGEKWGSVCKVRAHKKLHPHMAPDRDVEPGPHWWEASALNTASSLLYFSRRDKEEWSLWLTLAVLVLTLNQFESSPIGLLHGCSRIYLLADKSGHRLLLGGHRTRWT